MMMMNKKVVPALDEMLGIDTVDLFQDMKERQIEYVSAETYNPSAAFVSYRRYLVDWMADQGQKLNLLSTTIHVAVLYLDKILRTRNGIPRSQWQLLATCCISLAAKYEEREEDCPMTPDLLKTTKLHQEGHTSLSFRDSELRVLQYLGWKLRAFPAIHVVGYFLAKTPVVLKDDIWNKQLGQPSAKVCDSVRKFTDFFCNLCLQQYSFQQYLPTQLAAAILMASRAAVQVEPHWRPELTLLSGYEEWELEDCFLHVWNYYSSEFPNHVNHRSVSPRSVAVAAVRL
jgi:hypothetical protein